MGIPYNKYIQFLRSSKKKRRQLACFVTALSVFVSGGVFWQLRGIGTAMVDENLPNADDSGEAISVTPLNASELETQDVWEATLPPLTDIAGENLARIAESQLGYSESSVNFVHAEDGETHNGYTRYGAWYGTPYGEWNTMFTYFCLNYAGVSSDDIPYGSGCWAWSLELDKAGLIVPVTRGSPARGDILLIDSDLDGKADRSCIVQSVADDEISAVEGDIDGSVALTSYLIGDEQLLGMVSLADIVPEPPILPDEPAEVDFSAESESGICVEAHADRDAFPPDTEMFVFDISQDEAVQAAADHFGDEAPDDIQAVAVDITFRSPDGEELEPAEDSQVRVSIVLPEEQSLTGGEFSLLHVSDEGDVQEVADADVSADGADFVAEEFSVYVLTSNSTPTISDLNVVNLSQITAGVPGSSQDNPLIITVGQHITVYSDEPASGWGFTIYPNDRNGDGINTLVRDSNHTGNASLNNGMVAYYVGNSSDSTIIQFDDTPKVYVKVIEPQIYVKTALEEKQIDRVKEWLKPPSNDLPEKDGYVPNGPGKLSTENKGRPYVIRIGDSFDLFSTAVGNFTIENQYTLNYGEHTNWLYELSDSTEPIISKATLPADEIVVGNTTARFVGQKEGEAKIVFKTEQGYTRSVWVRVMPVSEYYTHADMEIADGGKYTITDISYDEHRNKITTVKVYNAFVNYVNFANVYGVGTTPIQTYRSNSDPSLSDYEITGTEGGTQYELTSAYKCLFNTSKHYRLLDVKHVLFDINIELMPTAIYTIDQNNNVTLQESFTPEQGKANHSFINNIQYDFGQQDIIDAMNKCPLSNGLDFTVISKGAVVKLKAIKELDGEKPNADQFEFELVNSDGEVVSTAKNDANGNVVFLDQVFSEPGTYNYTVREIVPANSTDYIYDTTPKPITVTISEVEINGTKVLTAKISEIPELKNYTPYTLPATGGTGELPYILFGSAMLSGAFILLFIRRKRRRHDKASPTH